MNRIGNWIDQNPTALYKKDSYDEDYLNFKKFMIQIQVEAEKLVMQQQKEKIDKRRELLKFKMKQNKKDSPKKGKKKKQNQIEYNEKDIFVNQKIEKDIKFFKNNYHEIKKEVFWLRKEIKANIEKQTKRKAYFDGLKKAQ